MADMTTCKASTLTPVLSLQPFTVELWFEFNKSYIGSTRGAVLLNFLYLERGFKYFVHMDWRFNDSPILINELDMN